MVNRAVIVAVQEYPELAPRLQGPANDARKFEAWVTTHGGVDPTRGHLKMILDQPPRAARALDAKPTAEIVKDHFDELETIAVNSPDGRAGDRLYLYMSGHGFGQDLDTASVLMANATQRLTRNHIPGRLWADHFYAMGFFKEVFLFLDCCRERYGSAVLNGPGTDKSAVAPKGARRFYGFAAGHGKLAVERTIDGATGGVFTATLLDGLRGEAADESGRVTGESLKAYLFNNMKAHLGAEDLAGKDVATEPDVHCDQTDDEFVIVTVPQVKFDVDIPIPAGLQSAARRLAGQKNGNPFATLAQAAGDGSTTWRVSLPLGTYQLLLDGVSKIVTVAARGMVHVDDPD